MVIYSFKKVNLIKIVLREMLRAYQIINSHAISTCLVKIHRFFYLLSSNSKGFLHPKGATAASPTE